MIRYPDKYDVSENFQLARALFNWTRLSEVAAMRAWLQQELNRLDKENRSAEGPDLYRRQGACLVLEALLRHAQEAGDMADKLQENRLQRAGASISEPA